MFWWIAIVVVVLLVVVFGWAASYRRGRTNVDQRAIDRAQADGYRYPR